LLLFCVATKGDWLKPRAIFSANQKAEKKKRSPARKSFPAPNSRLSGFALTCDWFICLDLSKPFLTSVLLFQNYETSLAKQKQGIETDGYLRDATKFVSVLQNRTPPS